MRNKVAEAVANLGACAAAVDWLAAEDFSSLQAAWDACPRADWMLWLARREGNTPYKTLVSIYVQCGRLALSYVRDETLRAYVARSLDTTEAWVRGEGTIEEVRAAAYVAYARADDSSGTDAVYAVYAVYAAAAADAARAYAADAAYADAYDESARATVQAQCADIVRAVLPIAPSLG